MPRKPQPKQPQSATFTDVIRVGKLNGSKVLLDARDWQHCTDLLERAGYRIKFETEMLLHGTNEGDILPKTMAASA